MFQKDNDEFSAGDDCMLGLRVKSVILLDRACRLASGRLSGASSRMPSDDMAVSQSFWVEVKSLEALAIKFLQSLPPIWGPAEPYQDEFGDFATEHSCKSALHERLSLNPMLVTVHTMARGDLMEIYHISAACDPMAYAKLVEQAMCIADFVKEVKRIELCRMISSGGVRPHPIYECIRAF